MNERLSVGEWRPMIQCGLPNRHVSNIRSQRHDLSRHMPYFGSLELSIVGAK